MKPIGLLQREILQAKPFISAGHEAVLSLLRSADIVRRRLTRVVEPHGITLQQFNVLRILRGAGAAGLPTLEIAHRMIEQTPGITRLLDRLEAKLLIRRERCPVDRRQVLCYISNPGLALLEAIDEPMREADATAVDMLSASEQKGLIRTLDAIRAGQREPA